MRIARFRDPAGSVRTGEWTDSTVRFGEREYDHEEVEILPPSEPSKIVCVGLNYADHAEETGKTPPERPLLFMKGQNAIAAHGDHLTLPEGKDRIDWEAELGVVIDEQCKDVSAEDAMDVVRGFTCVDDVSNRDDQEVEQNWIRGKAFDGSAPLGPCIAPTEDVPEDASIELRTNGETMQSSDRSELIFEIPALIEEITTYLTLEAGDVIATGTPGGVGPLSDGDTVEIEVEGVGTLEHTVEIP